MTLHYISDSSYDYVRIYRHWSPLSETYAGGDALLTAMDQGWTPEASVYCEEFWHAGSRIVTVYHFTLRRGANMLEMPVIGNPYLRRVLKSPAFNVLPNEEREAMRLRDRGNGAHGQ